MTDNTQTRMPHFWWSPTSGLWRGGAERPCADAVKLGDVETVRSVSSSETDDAKPDHLTLTTSERGFKHLPAIAGAYAGSVRVYESSAARGPHLWLHAETPGQDVTLHLSAEAASQVRDQIDHLLEHHYQGDARP